MHANEDAIRVIHVDDEPDFADLAATFLEREDERFDVETTTSAGEGLELLSTTDVDCVVSDHDMPEKNGIEFLEEVRDCDGDLPFVLFTGKGSEEVASDAISAGVTDYLQKESGTDQYAILANRIANAVESRRKEREVERTRTQLGAISENSADAIVTIDADSRIRFANPAVEDLFGYAPEDIAGEPLTTIMPERFHDRHLAAMGEYLETGTRSMDWSNVEFPGRHADGSEIPISVSYGEYELDGTQRFIGIMRDITDLRERERQLREKQADLRVYERAIEGSSDFLAAIDTEYEYLFANERYRRFHDLAEADVERRTLPEVLDEMWDAEVGHHIERVLDGEVVEYEMQRPGPDGETRTLDITYYPLTGGDDSITGAVTAMRDVTEHSERE